ncbi:MAG: hypothetical protein IH586_08865, partial [Anaerolineaceae bacterium]|nr:hypothetical protein [Anaerolineaceae bacterium]
MVLLIPGGSLLAWLQEDKPEKTDPLALLADAAALSIAMMTLLALWLYLGGIKASPLGLNLFYAAGILFLLGGIFRKWITWRDLRRAAGESWRWLLAMGLLVALSAWRFYQARDLVL